MSDRSDPGLKFENLKEKDRYAAFLGVVENHYRYYQYYANTLAAILLSLAADLAFGKAPLAASAWFAIGGVSVALFLGAHDALKKYYERANAVLK